MPTNTPAEWYYARNGAQTGPRELGTLRAMIAAGQLSAQDLVWRDGMASWTAIAQVPALQVGGFAPPQSGADSSPTYASSQAAPQPQAYAQPGYASPMTGYNPAGVGPSQQGMAIAGFILAFVFPLLGIIFSIIALKGMKTHRNDEGKGLAMAGLIISIAWFALGCLWLILVFAVFGAAAASGGR